MSEVLLEQHAGWAELTLNRPERRNAVNLPMARALRDALRALAGQDDLRAVVVAGAGGAFCSGLDLKEFNTDPPPSWRPEFNQLWEEVHVALMESPLTLITALQGGAINAGAALALAGDLMVAGRSAFVQVGEAQFGMPAPRNVSWLVLRHGEAAAMRLCLLADRVGADDLLRLNLASEMADDEQVLPRARALAGRLAGFPVGGLRGIKAAVRRTSLPGGAKAWLDAAVTASPAAASFKPGRVG